MHSFKLLNDWKQLTDRKAAWGLNPPETNHLIELEIEQQSNGLYTILYRNYPDDGMHYTVVADVKPVNSSELKELVRFLAYRIATNEGISNTQQPCHSYGYVRPNTPTPNLKPILEFLEQEYDDTKADMNVPVTKLTP